MSHLGALDFPWCFRSWLCWPCTFIPAPPSSLALTLCQRQGWEVSRAMSSCGWKSEIFRVSHGRCKNALPGPCSSPTPLLPLWICLFLEAALFGRNALPALGDRWTHFLANLGRVIVDASWALLFFVLGASCLERASNPWGFTAAPGSSLWEWGLLWAGVASSALGECAQFWAWASRPLGSHMVMSSSPAPVSNNGLTQLSSVSVFVAWVGKRGAIFEASLKPPNWWAPVIPFFPVS